MNASVNLAAVVWFEGRPLSDLKQDCVVHRPFLT